MAARSLSYLDITPEQRREAAARTKSQLRSLLANPANTMEQRALLQARIAHLSQWEAGLLDAPERAPVNHSVSLTEGLSITEDEI